MQIPTTDNVRGVARQGFVNVRAALDEFESSLNEAFDQLDAEIAIVRTFVQRAASSNGITPAEARQLFQLDTAVNQAAQQAQQARATNDAAQAASASAGLRGLFNRIMGQPANTPITPAAPAQAPAPVANQAQQAPAQAPAPVANQAQQAPAQAPAPVANQAQQAPAQAPAPVANQAQQAPAQAPAPVANQAQQAPAQAPAPVATNLWFVGNPADPQVLAPVVTDVWGRQVNDALHNHRDALNDLDGRVTALERMRYVAGGSNLKAALIAFALVLVIGLLLGIVFSWGWWSLNSLVVIVIALAAAAFASGIPQRRPNRNQEN